MSKKNGKKGQKDQKAESIVVVVPSCGNMQSEAVSNITHCLLRGQEFWIKRTGGKGRFAHGFAHRMKTAAARNSLVYASLNEGFDWMLWLDDDALPPPDLLERLWESKGDAKMIMPFFAGRHMPYKSVFFRYVEDGKGGGGLKNILPVPRKKFWVDATGFHAVLMHRSVLERVRQFILEKVIGPDDIDPKHRQEPAMFHDHYDKRIGQDVFFSQIARKAGVEMWVDPTIEVGHLTVIGVGRKQHDDMLVHTGSESYARGIVDITGNEGDPVRVYPPEMSVKVGGEKKVVAPAAEVAKVS